MEEKKKIVKMFWVSESELKKVHERIMECGRLDYEEDEHPHETGDPYTHAKYFTLYEGNTADVFYEGRRKNKLSDIRMTVNYNPVQEASYNKKSGYRPSEDPITEAINNLQSETLSPYMRYAMWKALGINVEVD